MRSASLMDPKMRGGCEECQPATPNRRVYAAPGGAASLLPEQQLDIGLTEEEKGEYSGSVVSALPMPTPNL